MLRFRSLTVRFLLLCLFSFTFAPIGAPLSAQLALKRRTTKDSASSAHIRLVLGITIDQFREDYLDRFGDLYGEGGFKRLLKQGALFANAHYLHACTYTAPGHSVVLTGSVAAQTGIIGNSWYDRESGRNIESITDPKYVGVPSGKGSAPTRLLVTTLGDQMKMATGGKSRVIGVSLKDRSAILPAGRNADAAYWFDSKTGDMQTSTYYMEKLPAWVEGFNAKKIPASWFGKRWEKSLPESAYARSDRDDASYEGRFAGGGASFPHTVGIGDKPDIRFYEDFTKTPWSNDMLVDFAAAALENEQLGADDAPDVLSVSFSANDILGHAFGPFSQEMEEMTLRTDRSIARLLDIVDKRVGLSNTLIFLTADHGVAPIPEYSQTHRLGGRRIGEKAILDAVYKALVKEYGDGEWIVGASSDSIYLNLDTIAAKKLKRDDVECTAGEAALAVPGVATYFTRTQLLSGPLPPTDIARRVAMAFNPQRSGDLYLVPEPFAFFSEGSVTGTTHGTPYPYDTHVPVLLMGPGVRAGKYLSEASPSDIAPTLASLLGVAAPNGTVGRILREAVEK